MFLLAAGLGQSGCAFLGGAALGAGGTGGAYEYQAYRQIQQLEEDHKKKQKNLP